VRSIRGGGLIPDSIIEEIRARVDVVAVVGRHVELKRSGRTWKGNCVFHGEKTPSFHVYPEDKSFHCFGCGAHGDVFTFLQRLEGKEFREVVRALAAEVGVEIPEAAEVDSAEARERRKERNEILAASDAAARYWAARLATPHGAAARAYLDRRGVSEESRRRFRLGVAADSFDDLSRRLGAKGLGALALKRAGLVGERREGRGVYDRFRDRLMFPIAGMDGQVIGFGGRALGDDPAKYINTPETPLYKKSRVLYGLDLARETIRKTRRAVLVEGYFDVIGLHQVGISSAVAVCGTALTPEHVELLSRCDCREVVILFDGDAAGQAAPGKAAEALLPSGIAGKVAQLPSEGGKIDPDDYARAHGGAGVEKLLAGAIPISDFIIDGAVREVCGGSSAREASFEQKIQMIQRLRPVFAALTNRLARNVFLERVAKRLDVDANRLWEEVEPPAQRRGAPDREPRPRTSARAPAGSAAQPMRVRVLLGTPALDALAILAAYPHLGPIGEQENFPLTLPEGPIADLARDLTSGVVPLDQVLDRLRGNVDGASLNRIRDLMGPACPAREQAERSFRRAVLKAKLEQVIAEYDRSIAHVTRAGSPIPEDLATRQLRLLNQRRDLERRVAALDRSAG
jgi:DNA primase